MPVQPRYHVQASFNEREFVRVEEARRRSGFTMYEFVRSAVLDRTHEILTDKPRK
jgi:hypothetical protein